MRKRMNEVSKQMLGPQERFLATRDALIRMAEDDPRKEELEDRHWTQDQEVKKVSKELGDRYRKMKAFLAPHGGSGEKLKEKEKEKKKKKKKKKSANAKDEV